MNGFLLVAGAAGLVAVGALAFVETAFSWPQRVRWTVVAQSMDPIGWGSVGHPPIDIREVVLVSVHQCGRVLWLGVEDEGSRVQHPRAEVAPAPAPEIVALLREWCSLRTPMLLYTNNSGVGALSGPSATITNLRAATVHTPVSNERQESVASPRQRALLR